MRRAQRVEAVLLDRDGTLIVDRDYLGDPDRLELLEGAAGAVADLNRAGVGVYLVTNQSGIGRGYFTMADFTRVQQRLGEILTESGARLDGVYFCPHSPEVEPPCNCRKPAAGLFRRAAAEHGFDLSRAAFIGDRLRDVTPALEFGGRGIIIGTSLGEADAPPGVERAPSLRAAVDLLLKSPPAGDAAPD